jgi:hypothetical protein
MKRSFQLFFFGLFLAFLGTSLWAEGPIRVQVQEGIVRARPSFLGEVVGRLPYGTRVLVLEEKGSWSKISSSDGSLTGWLASSAISTARVETNIGEAGVTTTSNENALAGKGFTDQIEQNYKATNHLDYTWVDRMEKIVPPQALFESFEKYGAFQ